MPLATVFQKAEDSWTEKQKEIFIGETVLLDTLSTSEVADELNISPNTLYVALRATDFPYYQNQLMVLQDTLKLIDVDLKRKGKA